MQEAKAAKPPTETSQNGKGENAKNGKAHANRFTTSPELIGAKVKRFIDRERESFDQLQGNLKNVLKFVTGRKKEEQQVMRVLIGRKAPDFKATAVFEDAFKEIQLSQYAGKYVLLFFYPMDFTFVCPTELHAFQESLDAFQKRGVEVLACSVDSQFSHRAWLTTPKEKGGIEGVQYGLISDLGGRIAHEYGVLSDEGVAYRALFLLDQQGIVRHQLVNDLPLGRNVDEALRIVDALQHVEKSGEVCPANWQKGGKAIQASHESVVDYMSGSPRH